MEVASLMVAGLAILAAGIAGGIAYGYRGQVNVQRDQVEYLRGQIARLMNEPPPTSRALATVPGSGRL